MFNIQDITPVSSTHTTIKTGELFDCSHNFVTKYLCDAYRTMTFKEFVDDIVPHLQDQSDDKFFHYEIRDLSNGNYFVLEKDGVIQYRVKNITDMPYEQFKNAFMESLRRPDESSIKRTIINSPFSVYSWGEGSGVWEMAVKIPELRFKYHSTNIGDRFIYMPPVLYTVQGTETGQYRRAYIKVITQDSILSKNMTFGRLCLPNVEPSSGHICVGSTYINSGDTEKLEPSQIVARAWDLFLGSNWNLDYISSTIFPDNVFEVADKYEIPESKYKDLSTQTKKLKAVLAILENKGAWEDLKWNPIA